MPICRPSLFPLALPGTVAVKVELQGEKRVRVVGVYNASAADPLHNRAVEEDIPRALALLPLPSHLLLAGGFNLHHPLWEGERTSAPTPAAGTLVSTLNDASLSPLLTPGTTTFLGHNGAAEGCNDLFGRSAPLATPPLKRSDGTYASDDAAKLAVPITPYSLAMPMRTALKKTSSKEMMPRKVMMSKRLDMAMRPQREGKGGALEVLHPGKRREVNGHNQPAPYALPHSLLRTLPRPQASLLTRLRTDFSSLAAALHRAHLHPDGLCPCGERETREHFLLSCPLYTLHRRTLLRELRLRDLPPHRALLSTVAFARPLLRFINVTDRFPRFYAAVKEEDEGEEEQDSENKQTNKQTPTPSAERPWPDLQEEEVRAAIFTSCTFGGPGADGLPNAFLQLLWHAIRIRLVPLLAAITSAIGHLPRSWRDTLCLVLRKPKKPDYPIPKAYRLISVERTLAKLAEKLVARRGAHLRLVVPRSASTCESPFTPSTLAGAPLLAHSPSRTPMPPS
ncbi:hypothetical protein JCM10213_008730 [Rhodosporidiobolus nylandii]